MSSVLFPFWVWLLIVLIIILIVLWFLFRPSGETESAGSDSHSGGDAVHDGAEAASVSDAAFVDEVPAEIEEAVESEEVGVLHVVDAGDEEDTESDPDEATEAVVAEAVAAEGDAAETLDEEVEDVVVFEGDLDGKSAAAVEAEPVVEDDLKIIEGIGPKIESILKQEGVKTLRQISEMGPDAIQTILTKHALRLANPASWPEQARLAVAGDRQALAELQDRLKGGRIVS